MQICVPKVFQMRWCRTVLPTKLQIRNRSRSQHKCFTDDIIDVDELRVSIEIDSDIKYTLGTIYRHPKANLTKFNDRLCVVLQKIILTNQLI